MNQRFILFQRSGVFYYEDRQTRKQISLRTRDRAEALTLLHAKNESARQPVLNLQLARVYLAASDPQVATRTWQAVMDEIIRTKTGANQTRWIASAKSKQFDALRSRKLIETQPEHLLHVLQEGTVSTNVYLRRMHNFAVDMNWLPASIIPKRQWPPVCYKEKRAITFDEHTKIIEREQNPATRAFYQLLWHLGGSQSDIATLTATDIDWRQRTVSYQRHKTGVASPDFNNRHNISNSLVFIRTEFIFKQSRPPRRFAAGQAGNCFDGDNWQHCRSLDDAMTPVRSFYGPAGLVLSRLQTPMRCAPLSPAQWPLLGRSSYSALRCPRRRLFPIERRPSITPKIDLESMTSQRPPNFRVS